MNYNSLHMCTLLYTEIFLCFPTVSEHVTSLLSLKVARQVNTVEQMLHSW